jgi:phage repressor protein C with HTH and peptisase S24 domain
MNEINMRFADIRRSTSLNKKQFADSLDINQSVAGDIELGKRDPSREVMLKLAAIYNVDIHWLLTGEGAMLRTAQIPLPTEAGREIVKTSEGFKVPLLRQKVSCGPGADWQDEQNVKEYIDIFSLASRIRPGRMFALSVQGNSMIGAGIRNGDYVLFNAETDQYLDDGIYVFALDGDVYCKQLEFDGISKKIKIYSVRVADQEKAELLTTLNIEDAGFPGRFTLFGRVVSWVHPNFDVD